MKFITNLLITAIAVFIISKILEPHVLIDTFSTSIIFAIVLGFFDAIVKPLLVILTFPLTIITLGIFLLVINVLIILMADHFVTGINIDGFWWALIFGFLLTIISTIFLKLQKKMDK